MSLVPRQVVVVGGGIGGLSAAWEAQERAREVGLPVTVTVVESRDRVGGSIISERVDDCLVEGGPDCFVSEKPGGIQLAKDLGLESRLAPTNEDVRKSYVLWKGRLHPLPDGLILLVPTQIVPFVTSSLFSWPGKVRMGMDLVLPRGRDRGDETLGDFIRRRFGGEALEKLGEPLVAGIHSGDPETMSVQATFPRFLNMEREQRSLILAMLGQMKAARERQAAAERDAKRGKAHTLFVTMDAGVQVLVDELDRRIGADHLLTGETASSLAPRERRPLAAGDRHRPRARRRRRHTGRARLRHCRTGGGSGGGRCPRPAGHALRLFRHRHAGVPALGVPVPPRWVRCGHPQRRAPPYQGVHLGDHQVLRSRSGRHRAHALLPAGLDRRERRAQPTRRWWPPHVRNWRTSWV